MRTLIIFPTHARAFADLMGQYLRLDAAGRAELEAQVRHEHGAYYLSDWRAWRHEYGEEVVAQLAAEPAAVG